jgi:hypothetical protein
LLLLLFNLLVELGNIRLFLAFDFSELVPYFLYTSIFLGSKVVNYTL